MKKIIVVLFVVYAALVLTGFSWGGVGRMPLSMRDDNSVNYIPWPVYDFTTWQITCWLLPFERYYTDDLPMAIDAILTKYRYVNSGRCYGIVNWEVVP